ncbi:MAG: CHAT domain-containing protein [Verrucomicrobiales bacterium]|nr:CHAT domain-containing protein [Verrucomicrobiales bacterium]
MNRFLFIALALASPSFLYAQAPWIEYTVPTTIKFPNGYSVVKEPKANSKVEKNVPGPAEATVKWLHRNPAGVVFYLSDWSSDRRMRGQDHFWILPNGAPEEKPHDATFRPLKKVEFPNGFQIVEETSPNAPILSTVPGPATADAKAQRVINGVTYYMTEWSWDRAQRGIPGNWMRAIQAPSTPLPPKIAPLPKSLEISEREYERVFEFGIETLEEPKPDAKFVPAHTEPVAVKVAAEASLPHPSGFGRHTFYLTPMAQRNRLEGKPYVWMRDALPKDNPDLLPRMRTLLGEHEVPFPLEVYLNRPWAFSAALFDVDPEKSLIALREFDLLPLVTDMAPFFDDQEFPIAWMKEAAAALNRTDDLEAAITALRGYLPKREKALELWATNEEGEMMGSYARDRIRFDQRVLALFEAERGNYSAVEPLLAPLIADWNPDSEGLNASGPSINMLREIARSQWKLGKTAKATESTRTWVRAYSRDIANELLNPEYRSASERFTEFDSDFEKIGDYFDLLEAVTDPQVAAEIVVGLKGLRLAVSSFTQVRRKNYSDPQLAQLTDELFSLEEDAQENELNGRSLDHEGRDRIFKIRAELASRRLSGVGVDLNDNAEWRSVSAEINRLAAAGSAAWELDELTMKRDLLAMDHLIEKGGFLIRPDDLEIALEPDEVLIDFFQIPAGSVGESGSYGAVILRKDAAPKLVNIGKSGIVDTIVKRYRDLMTGQGEFALASLDDLNQQSDKIIAETFAAVLKPLMPELQGSSKVLFSTEGQLSFLPFDLLGESSETLLHSSFEVSYVNASRDLLKAAPKSEDNAKRSALLLGNPIFDTQLSALASTSAPAGIDEASRSILAEASRGVEFVQLPGTEKEINLLEPKLNEAGFETVSLAEGEATEANLIEAVESPTILHFATHGFFLNRLPVANQGVERNKRSAMLLSGLALTGAQSTLESWNRGQIPNPGNDGILFASEVSQLDLSNTKIVVLSACETAVGKSLSGEGVEGLRSGLTLAGAQNVMITLWPVDDVATVTLMEDFYTRLLGGTAAHLALVETKRALFDRISKEVNPYLAHRLVGPFLMTRTGLITN